MMIKMTDKLMWEVKELSRIAMDDAGVHKPIPFAEANRFSQEAISGFCHEHGLYQFLTTELIDFLKEEISSLPALEIGAGNGGLCKALRIIGTDNRIQERPDIAAQYAAMQQPVIRYGNHVEWLDAHAAIQKYRPAVIVGAWVTDISMNQNMRDYYVDESTFLQPETGASFYFLSEC